MGTVKSIVGGVLFALGGLMTISCLVLIPVVWAEPEYFLARLVTHVILIGMFGVVTWTGWRWVRKNPDPETVTRLELASASPPPLQQPATTPNVTVILQNAQHSLDTPGQVIHVRCSHCGTTTPESERRCGNCGASLR